MEKTINWLEKNLNWVLIILLSFAIISPFVFTSESLTQRFNFTNSGGIGETINGLVSPFLSLITIILVFLTYSSQKEHISSQREEAKELKAQSQLQQFENTFYNMINVLNNIIYESTYSYINIKYEGHQFFSFAISELKRDYSKDDLFLKQFQSLMEKETGIEAKKFSLISDNTNIFNKNFCILKYEYFHNKFHSQLGHFYRYTYNVIKFVIDKQETKEKQQLYIDQLQAQLSNDQLALIFYNALSKYGRNKEGKMQFFEWLEKYQFFENLDDVSLLNRQNHIFYPKTIFKFLTDEEREKKKTILEKK